MPEAEGSFGRSLCLMAMMMQGVTIGALRFPLGLSVVDARRRISDVARRWQMDPQQVYRWRHSEGVSHRRPMRKRRPAAPDFVPIVTDAMLADAAAPAALATPMIEVRLAGAVVRVVSGLDDAQLTAVLRAVRASALRT